MEQAILALLGVVITLILYLDRARRSDIAQLRTEMRDGLAEVRADNAQLRTEMRADNAQLRTEMNDGFKRVYQRIDKLTDTVMDLCRRVGRLEGRVEASAPTTGASP